MNNTRAIRILSVALSLLMAIGMVCISRGTVSADVDTATGLEYTISGGKATITGFTAPAGFSGVLDIPEILGGARVTSIRNYAFYDRIDLISVKIPDGVTSIGERVFTGCTGLTSVTLPDSVTSMGEFAFYGCTGLASVTLPSGLTSIEECAFYGCTGLTSVTIPNGVISIGKDAFIYCTGLTSVTIPNSVTSIGAGAFSFCTGLTSVTIPDSVTSIGEYAFFCCTELTNITIPAGVTSIGAGPFGRCENLSAIEVNEKNPNYKSTDGILYTKDGTQLINCPGAKSGSITIPSVVINIGEAAFVGCTGLSRVVIPNSVTSIGEYAFYICTNLNDAYFLGNAPTMGAMAFLECAADFTVRYLSTATEFTNPWNGYPTELFSSITDTTTGLTYLFEDGKVTITDFSAPSGFSGALAIPSSIGGLPVTRIGNDAFANCTSLTSISIPGSVTGIGDGAFSGCTGLVSIGIPENVTSIGNGAFSNCPNLSDATFSGNAPTMGTDVFAGSASDFIVSYVNTATGFTNPWNGYTALPLYTAGVSYRTHVQDVGWQG
jgi:hypothetical protein